MAPVETPNWQGTLGERLRQIEADHSGRRISFFDWSMRVPEAKVGPLDFDRFPFQRELYGQHSADDEEIVVKKCLAPETRVLTDDLRWVRMDTLNVGDGLVAFDENLNPPRPGKTKKRARRLRRAVVEAVTEVHEPAFRITLDNGMAVTATGDHRFLWRASKVEPAWREVKKMKVGQRIRAVAAPWEPGDRYEDGWFAGMLDGEGSLRGRATGSELVLTQQPGPVFDRALAYMRGEGIEPAQALEDRPNGKPVARARVSNVAGIMRLVGRSRPERFTGTTEWWDGKGLGGTGNSWPRIVSIEPLGKKRMLDIQTSAKTFVAEGLASHNSTQVGVSTYLLRWTMYLADARGFTVLYLFPKRAQMYDFADARIRSAIMASPYLRNRIPGGHIQNKGLKQIGVGYLYCRGSESRDDLQSIDADALAMDEYDDLRPENIPDAERRVSGSQHHMIRRVGVPDIPNQGVDRLYAESDMRRWFVKCAACGLQQHLEWSNVDTKNIRLICNGCHKPRIDVKKGEWVAEHTDRRIRGYHIPRLVVPGVNLRAIVEASRKTNPTEVKTHQNKDLGLAFTPEEGQISLDRIMAAQRSEIRQSYVEHDGRTMGELRTMGVDVASVRALNVRASAHFPDGTKQSIYLGTAENFEAVAGLMRSLDIHMCTVDHLPEGRLARAFAEKFPGRVYLANYASGQNLVTKIDDKMRTVSVRRTEAIDATLDMIRQQRNRLPGELPDNYVRDLQNLIRTVETDDHGKTTVSYREMGPTDYGHCEVYDLLASEVWWWLKSVDEADRGQIQPLEEMYDFERSALEGGNADYDPGNFE